MFSMEFSGSRREREEAAYIFLWTTLRSVKVIHILLCFSLKRFSHTDGRIVTDDGRPITLEDFLFFCTGARSEPPLGFPNQPVITFCEGKLITASTCTLVARLPLEHTTFADFKAFAILSIGGLGFHKSSHLSLN